MLLQVKRLAQRCRVSADTIRYYTQIGLLRPARHPTTGYKLYGEKDVKRVDFIRRARYLGYALQEIAQIFEEAGRGKSPCPLVRDLIQRHIAENRKRLEEVLELQSRMEQALAQWATMPDGVPDGDTVCRLIESIENPDLLSTEKKAGARS
ncbi:MerR family transcriptional regulator [Methylocaldum sp. BRCS4]|jgi:MerR family Zn(II)-responsive transcriptional regulator of zntA|nr:MerR family transcriptional regulator [Methylocaldum sp. BRCS4]